jgi:anthranilate 1,2-dioxygenase large subunit
MRNDAALDLRWPAKFNEIPKEVFHRVDVFKLELERIFHGPEWHPVAHIGEIPAPGDLKTGYVGAVPVLIVHGDDGVVRVFQNSCAHRGTQLKTCARGRADKIECPYHRWTFSNRGELIGVPGMGDFPSDFRKENYGLRVLRSAEICGLVFVTLSERAPPLKVYLDDTVEHIARAMGGDGRLNLLGYQKVAFASNWKEYSDNEGYHGPLLHAAFRMLKFAQGEGVQFMTPHAHKVNSASLAVPEPNFIEDGSVVESRDPKLPPHNIVVSLFPVTIITRNLDVISIRYATPISPDETEVHYAYFAHADDDADLVQHRIRQASNLIGPSGFISLEDGAVFNRLHVGSHSDGNVAFQKGVRGPIHAPYVLDKGDEAGNLIRWEHYREAMGFARD